MPKTRIIFRADGNSQIGLGHVMRCLALSEMLKKKFICVFAISKPDEALELIVKPFGNLLKLRSLNKNDELLELEQMIHSTDIVVVDGYLFDDTYIQFLKSAAYKLVVIDDFASGYFSADLVLNHGNEHLIYNKSKHTKVLCGFDYLILRREFLNAALSNKRVTKIENVFICMGGADPGNVTLKVLKSCIAAEIFNRITVVTGAAYNHQVGLVELIARNKSSMVIEHYINLDASGLVELMLRSQVCVCPSSSIALEVCCVGAGLLTGTTVNNQNNLHSQLLADECAISVGDFNEVTIDEIVSKLKMMSSVDTVNQMIQNQRNAIDGRSAERILKEFNLLTIC